MKKDNKALNDLDQEFNLFMHSQVPEVEPEDTDTIHPDYELPPAIGRNTHLNTGKGIPMVANIPFKEPGPEAFDIGQPNDQPEIARALYLGDVKFKPDYSGDELTFPIPEDNTPHVQFINPAPLPDTFEGSGYAGHRHQNLDFEQAMKLAQYYGGNMVEETEERKKNMANLHDTGLLQELLDYKPKEQVYLGIDPGKSGGIVVLTAAGVVVDKFIMPILGDNLDVAKLYDLFTDLHRCFNITVVLEDVHSIFGMSAATNFVFGYVCGAIESVVLCLKLKLVKVPPKTWQKEIWSNGDKVYKPKKENQKNPSIDTKPTSLCAATRLFPTVDLRKSSKAKIAADGIVDALLLAEYGRRRNL